MGALVSRAADGRRDVAGAFSLPIRVAFALDDRWELAIGFAAPIPPIPAMEMPIDLRWRAGGGLVIQFGARAIIARVGVCATAPERCPLQQAELMSDRPRGGGLGLGAIAEVGFGYQWTINPRLALQVGLAYLGGPVAGFRQAVERPLTSYYQGGIVSISVAGR